jgi:glycosyltransferase involved in cell wall biosynthesis
MKVLVAMPNEAIVAFSPIDQVIAGCAPCSGTDGATIRLAALLQQAGISTCLSAPSQISSQKIQCIPQSDVDPDEFDYLILHQSHWDGQRLSWGNRFLGKTFLWLHNHIHQTVVHTFIREGGRKVICPSQDHANTYRALPNWRQRVAVIPNSYSEAFCPSPAIAPLAKPRLLFIGALTPVKDFIELMQIWTALAEQRVPLELAIAGSIGFNMSSNQVDTAQVTDADFVTSAIKSWLAALPQDYQSQFLGVLSPVQLQAEITQSWAVIVNPGYRVPETFCVSAVDAQACDRTVFSIKCGALPETVYQGELPSLAVGDPLNLCELIKAGLAQPDRIAANGKAAGAFVRQRFSNERITSQWLAHLHNAQAASDLSETWDSRRSLICDVMRWSRTWHLVNHYRNSEHRAVMAAYRAFKRQAG